MRWLGKGGLVAVVMICSMSARAAEVPRYALTVGKQLTYATTRESKSAEAEGAMSMSAAETWVITPVRENADGSRRVILKIASTFTQTAGGASNAMPPRTQVAYADVFPDGRMIANDTLGMQLDPTAVLPLLPKDDKELADGWVLTNAQRQQVTNYKPIKSEGNDFAFTGEETGVMSKIYATTEKTTFQFDRDRGAIASAQVEESQDYGFHTRGTGKIRLESVQTVPPEQIVLMAADWEAVFAAQKQYHEKMSGIDRRTADPDKIIEEAKAILDKAASELKTDDAKKELQHGIDEHAAFAQYVKESAGEFANVMDKPAPDWSSTDLEGKPVALADFKGKVVVMDFWYRGCGWCIYAMPQIKQLAADYKDKPVAVLGMNTDEDQKDARFVIDTMQLNYATIKATGVPEKYGVQGFPTLLVIDKEGIVRDAHVGYNPKLREEIGKKIDELLSK